MDTAAKLQPPAVEQVLRKLTVKADTGLSNTEAAQRLIKYGPNALVEKEVSWARKILGPFTGPIAYMKPYRAARPGLAAIGTRVSAMSCFEVHL